MVAFLIVYFIIGTLFFVFSNYNLLAGATDQEYRQMTNEDNGARLLALITLSLFWPISVIFMIYHLIFG